MLKVSKLYMREEGSGLMLCIFVLFIMLGVGGFAVDAGIIYREKGEMRKAANAAALSGIQKISSNDNAVIGGIIEDILVAHKPEYIPKENSHYWDDETPYWELEGDNTIKVDIEQTVNTHFMRIFGIGSIPLEVISRAKAGPIGTATGAVPLGVPMDSLPDEDDLSWRPLALKASPSDTSFGKYGIISFNQSDSITDAKKDAGAKPYKTYLEYGYQRPVDVGDTLFTQSGSVAADNKIMQDKMRNSIYPTIDSVKTAYANNTLKYTDSRIMLVIVYQEGSIIDATNNIRQITVAGFAYFYLADYSGNANDRTISGYIIPRTLTGSASATALDLGTYAISLTE